MSDQEERELERLADGGDEEAAARLAMLRSEGGPELGWTPMSTRIRSALASITPETRPPGPWWMAVPAAGALVRYVLSVAAVPSAVPVAVARPLHGIEAPVLVVVKHDAPFAGEVLVLLVVHPDCEDVLRHVRAAEESERAGGALVAVDAVVPAYVAWFAQRFRSWSNPDYLLALVCGLGRGTHVVPTTSAGYSVIVEPPGAWRSLMDARV